jgi:hypothetical protein
MVIGVALIGVITVALVDAFIAVIFTNNALEKGIMRASEIHVARGRRSGGIASAATWESAGQSF